MAYFPHGAVIAAHAARERRKQLEAEEENMTSYKSEDLEGNWEFKIVRAAAPVFRKPEVFQRLVEEEAMSGWELLEKLDDSRVRFKRHKDARRRDAALPPGVDPYRTQFGGSNSRAMVATMIGLTVTLLMGVMVFFLAAPGSDGGAVRTPILALAAGIPVVIVMIAVGFVIFAIRRR